MTAERFFGKIKDKKVAFVGIAVTNTETIKFFAKQGIKVVACDQRTEDKLDKELVADLRELRIELRLGEGYLNGLDAEIFFRTPGMYYNSEPIKRYRQLGGIVTSEMEVFCDLCPCPLIAVTGSDGKSTTSTLISEFFKKSGKTVHFGGNIGKPLLPNIFEIDENDIAVVELSSFQLISMKCAPQVSLITNITPNHLDIHGTMEEYIEAKKNVFMHQNAFSKTILGKDNEITASFVPEVRGNAAIFSLEEKVYNGAYLDKSGYLISSEFGQETKLFHKDEIRIPGMHNVANYLAAITATQGLVDYSAIETVAKTFGGVEHRIEFVREIGGVRWFNDAIATSPTRVIAGLKSFNKKIILIAGGYDKKIPFEPMVPYIIKGVKILLLSGPTAEKIEQSVMSSPDYSPDELRIIHTKDLPEAVMIAKSNAVNGDIVALSPACASFDGYPNFESKGKHFKELVNAL